MSDLLGEVVVWDMASAEVPYSTVVDALDESGLDVSLATELSPRAAFSRACKHLKENRTIDKLKSKGGVISFQFTKKALVGEEFEFEREARVELDCDTGEIKCDEAPELAEKATELLAFAKQTRTSSDITRLVQKMFATHADLYPINPKKGVAYFCPSAHRDFTAKVEDFMGKFGGKLWRYPVPKGTDEGNRSVRDAVASGLQTMLEELNEAVEGWDENTRGATMEKVQERYRVVSGKIDAYATYLLGAQEELMQRVEASKSRLVDRMIEIETKKGEAELAAV
jgi:hypothetical protein